MTDSPSAVSPTPTLPELPTLTVQAERLVELGVHRTAGLSAEAVQEFADAQEAPVGALLAVHPALAPASTLAPLLSRSGRPGFVVADMTDVDEFTQLADLTVPDSPLYLLTGVDRGDHMSNWSPDEALPSLTAAGRTPLLLTEGIHWGLQQPEAIERNHCYMTIGSRLRKADGTLDARTPAVWISNGTGRDGAGHRNAPKIGWCWAGNRHTWLGFASATGRSVP